jgi:hypothetical protein
MSLQYIPDPIKSSPLKSFIKYAEKQQKQEDKKKRKKLLSLEYFLYMRGILKDMFGFDNYNLMLSEFNISERKPKKIIKDLLSSFENKYFSNGVFNKEIFEQDYNNKLNHFINSFNINSAEEIAQTIVKKNEYGLNNNFENEQTFENIEEFKTSLNDRKEELEFLMLYLAKSNNQDFNKFIKKNESSQLVNDITNRTLFLNIRNEYQLKLNEYKSKPKKLKAL